MRLDLNRNSNINRLMLTDMVDLLDFYSIICVPEEYTTIHPFVETIPMKVYASLTDHIIQKTTWIVINYNQSKETWSRHFVHAMYVFGYASHEQERRARTRALVYVLWGCMCNFSRPKSSLGQTREKICSRALAKLCIIVIAWFFIMTVIFPHFARTHT